MRDRAQKIIAGEKLRVLFLNDTGFQYGAGIAHLRQIQSFLMLGHDIFGICWQQGLTEDRIPFIPSEAAGIWHGMRQFPDLDGRKMCDIDRIRGTILEEVAIINPDVVIVGNLHGGAWPLELLTAIHQQGCLIVAYMHDCYYVTGRCAYPFACERFLHGCNASCPTAHQYPQLPADQIEVAWQLRQEIFTNYLGIALAANSHWTLGIAKKALRTPNYADVVHLGLDHDLFTTVDRKVARHILGIPSDAFVIIAGAVNVKDARKGGHLFEQVVSRLSDDVLFLVFGRNPGLQGVKATGLIRDYRKMPLLYSAGDMFIGTSLAESFGQTYCEAAACGLPLVAFRVGGIPDLARHNVNAKLVDSIDVEQYIEEVINFMNNPAERLRYGSAGRSIVEAEFTLSKQAERWQHYLNGFAEHLRLSHFPCGMGRE